MIYALTKDLNAQKMQSWKKNGITVKPGHQTFLALYLTDNHSKFKI